jgi:hypothetical protein
MFVSHATVPDVRNINVTKYPRKPSEPCPCDWVYTMTQGGMWPGMNARIWHVGASGDLTLAAPANLHVRISYLVKLTDPIKTRCLRRLHL